jgi:hypothetical protein
MKITKNRLLMLELLANPIDGLNPPHCVGSLQYELKSLYAIHEQAALKTIPTASQIYRTLKDLIRAGVVTATKRLEEGNIYGNALPFWVTDYELSKDVIANGLEKDVDATYKKTHKAKFGCEFFGKPVRCGLSASDTEALLSHVKTLMSFVLLKGTEDQASRLEQCLEWIESGIDLPE